MKGRRGGVPVLRQVVQDRYGPCYLRPQEKLNRDNEQINNDIELQEHTTLHDK